jgi:hypothetical protein
LPLNIVAPRAVSAASAVPGDIMAATKNAVDIFPQDVPNAWMMAMVAEGEGWGWRLRAKTQGETQINTNIVIHLSVCPGDIIDMPGIGVGERNTIIQVFSNPRHFYCIMVQMPYSYGGTEYVLQHLGLKLNKSHMEPRGIHCHLCFVLTEC